MRWIILRKIPELSLPFSGLPLEYIVANLPSIMKRNHPFEPFDNSRAAESDHTYRQSRPRHRLQSCQLYAFPCSSSLASSDVLSSRTIYVREIVQKISEHATHSNDTHSCATGSTHISMSHRATAASTIAPMLIVRPTPRRSVFWSLSSRSPRRHPWALAPWRTRPAEQNGPRRHSSFSAWFPRVCWAQRSGHLRRPARRFLSEGGGRNIHGWCYRMSDLGAFLIIYRPKTLCSWARTKQKVTDKSTQQAIAWFARLAWSQLEWRKWDTHTDMLGTD